MYQIRVKKRAKHFIDSLSKNERERIINAIQMLPNGTDIKPVQGHPDLLRLRVGDYRIIYSIDEDELIVWVIDAGNRGQIYKRY